MKTSWATGVGLVLLVQTHSAMARPTAFGHGALALAALVGSYSTVLRSHDKAVLAGLFEGEAPGAPKAPVDVRADAVICRAGDVDIAAFACELTFGSKRVEITGRSANELFATIGEAGEPPEGAAGTAYEGLHALSCVIDPVAIARKDGSGATCDFDPGPP